MQHCIHHKSDLWLSAFADLHDQMQYLLSNQTVVEHLKIPQPRVSLSYIVNLRDIDRIILDPDELLIIFRFDIYKTDPGKIPPTQVVAGSGVARSKGSLFVFSEIDFEDGLCSCGCGSKAF